MIAYRALEPDDVEPSFALILKVAEEFLFPTYPKEGQTEFKNRLEQIKTKLADENYISFVAEEKEITIGLVQGSIREGHASLGLLFVDKKYHRKGIGARLMNMAESRFKEEVDVVNLKSSVYALEFYQNHSYTKTTGLRSKKGMVYYPMKKTI